MAFTSKQTLVLHSPPPRFDLGQVVATPGALALLMAKSGAAADFIRRHHAGDWGDLDPDDKASNEEAVNNGARIMSAYAISGDRLWVITEAIDDDGFRSATTLLLPEEY